MQSLINYLLQGIIHELFGGTIGLPMTNPTGLAEDLIYLRDRHAIASQFIDNLTTSPDAARLQIQLYKTNMIISCILPTLFGIMLIGFAIIWHTKWIALIAGVIGMVGLCYFLKMLLHKRKAISAVEKIASYHKLI
jgi:hypothetical protein